MNFTKLISFQFIIVLLISSCQNQSKQDVKNEKEDNFPIIIDTLGVLNYMRYYDGKNPTWLSTSSYSIFYIGEWKDTIYVDPFVNFSGLPRTEDSSSSIENPLFKRKHEIYETYYLEWPLNTKLQSYNESQCQIIVDSKHLFDSLVPVLIINEESDTIEISYGDYLPMIMEAMDSTGQWRPIQEMFQYMCGNGLGTYLLPPNNCVLTFAPIFNGEFKTKIRFTIGNNHSESFNGSIHYRQFKSMFGENGGYCEEYKIENKK